MCEITFKKRYANHKKLFNSINTKNDTTLSIEYWTLKQKQQAPRLTWEKNATFAIWNQKTLAQYKYHIYRQIPLHTHDYLTKFNSKR